MATVFISHATEDRPFIDREIVGSLGSHGVETWYAKEDIQGSEEWDRCILEGLRSSDWFLLVMSPRSAQSKWVKAEVDWAVKNRWERFIPVLMEDCDPESFHLWLARLQYVDFTRDKDEARRNLLAIKGLAETSVPLANRGLGGGTGGGTGGRPGLIVAAVLATLIGAAAVYLVPSGDREETPAGRQTGPGQTAAANRKQIPPLHAREVLDIAYNDVPAGMSRAGGELALVFEVLGRHAGQEGFAQLRNGDPLASKVDDYLVYAAPLRPGFLYICQVDSNGQLEWLFPKNGCSPVSSGSNPVAAGQDIYAPSLETGRALYLDEVTGFEHLYAVFSAVRWEGLEKALERAKARPAPDPGAVAAGDGAPAGVVQQPLALELRGVEGTRPIRTPLTITHNGGTRSITLNGQVLEGKQGILIVERVIRHVR